MREFFETLAAYERLLTEKNNGVTYAQYARRKISNKGVYQALIDWTRASSETDGFKALLDAGLAELHRRVSRCEIRRSVS